jgi:hypothetical protein
MHLAAETTDAVFRAQPKLAAVKRFGSGAASRVTQPPRPGVMLACCASEVIGAPTVAASADTPRHCSRVRRIESFNLGCVAVLADLLRMKNCSIVEENQFRHALTVQ